MENFARFAFTKQCRLLQRGGFLAARDTRAPDHLYATMIHFQQRTHSAYNPASLDDNMFPPLPPQDPSREHVISDSVPVTLQPADASNTLRHPVSAPRPNASADVAAAPAPSDADDAPAPPAPPTPSPTGRSTGADTPGVGGGGALGGGEL